MSCHHHWFGSTFRQKDGLPVLEYHGCHALLGGVERPLLARASPHGLARGLVVGLIALLEKHTLFLNKRS